MGEQEFILEAKDYSFDENKKDSVFQIAAIVIATVGDVTRLGKSFKHGVGGFKGALITYWQSWENKETGELEGKYSDYEYVSEAELVKLYNESEEHGKRYVYYGEDENLFPYKIAEYDVVATDGWSALWYEPISYPNYISCGDSKYQLVSEGHIRGLFGSLYGCLNYGTSGLIVSKFEYFDSKGVIQEKIWSDEALIWVQRKLLVEDELFLSLNDRESAFVKYWIRKTAELSTNEEYALAVARNRITYADCSAEMYSEFDAECGKRLDGFNPCASGVCKLIGDIDTADLMLPLPDDMRVLDFSNCKYLSKIKFAMYEANAGLPKDSIVLPKGSKSILSVLAWDEGEDISEIGLPSYGGNTIAFIGEGWLKAESLFFNEAVIEGISKIQIIGCENTSAPYEDYIWAIHPDPIRFYSVIGVPNLDIWCDYTKILCGREVSEALDLTCKIAMYNTDTEVLRITGNAPNLVVEVSNCGKLREVEIKTEGTVCFTDIIKLVNDNHSLERVTVKAGRLVGKVDGFEDFPVFKKALKRGVLATVEANSLQIDGKVSLSFDTGKAESCTLSWGGKK